jgi:hypothetical protein
VHLGSHSICSSTLCTSDSDFPAAGFYPRSDLARESFLFAAAMHHPLVRSPFPLGLVAGISVSHARVLSCASGIFFQADLCCSPRFCHRFLSCYFVRFPISLPFSCQFSLSALALAAGTSLALKPVDSSSCLPSSLPV